MTDHGAGIATAESASVEQEQGAVRGSQTGASRRLQGVALSVALRARAATAWSTLDSPGVSGGGSSVTRPIHRSAAGVSDSTLPSASKVTTPGPTVSAIASVAIVLTGSRDGRRRQ